MFKKEPPSSNWEGSLRISVSAHDNCRAFLLRTAERCSFWRGAKICMLSHWLPLNTCFCGVSMCNEIEHPGFYFRHFIKLNGAYHVFWQTSDGDLEPIICTAIFSVSLLHSFMYCETINLIKLQSVEQVANINYIHFSQFTC